MDLFPFIALIQLTLVVNGAIDYSLSSSFFSKERAFWSVSSTHRKLPEIIHSCSGIILYNV